MGTLASGGGGMLTLSACRRRNLHLPYDGVYGVTASRDATKVIVAGPANTVVVMSTTTGEILHWFGRSACGRLQFETIFRMCTTSLDTVLMAEVRIGVLG